MPATRRPSSPLPSASVKRSWSFIGWVRSLSVLTLSLGASVLVHAVLITARFVDPEGFNRVFQDTPLEVILVNTRGNERPEKAQAIAQASLAGGGEADKGRATSPLPPSALTSMGDAAEDAQRQVEQLQEQQNLLLAQIKSKLAAMPPTDPREKADTAEARDREETRRQLVKAMAEIERRINEENARPKKRYISPATREEVYAIYYDALRRKVEDRGTQNFPEAAGKKLYGELIMEITVNHDGKVIDADVAKTSGSLTLDRRAVAIARAAGPFGEFTSEMRRKADLIVVVSRFTFTRDETLQTQLTSR